LSWTCWRLLSQMSVFRKIISWPAQIRISRPLFPYQENRAVWGGVWNSYKEKAMIIGKTGNLRR
jgi:hypothetical protein